jgi:hypothetical protein
MEHKVNQIYHVARCGSTLLASLLSTVTTVYSEPSWSKALLIGVDPYKDMQPFYGSVVKFPSMVSCYPTDFPGKKIFLYRPLSQHLCKMKSVEPIWIQSRLKRIDRILKYNNHPKLSRWKLNDDLDKVTYMWLCSIFYMLDDPDILWIQTNDFLKNKQETLNTISSHFNLPKVSKLFLSDIHVKKCGLNTKDTPINTSINKVNHVNYVLPSYGIIETELALCDEDIKTRVNMLENIYPQLKSFLY